MRHSHPTAATWLSKQTMFLLIILFVAAAARFLLVLNLPILFFTYTIHDDTLFMRLATNLASGHWLGEYNQFTLMKGPGYPAFLAITSLSGLPLSIANALFQTVAISVAAWAAFRLSRLRVIAGLTFVALIFCPVGFVVQRVLRYCSLRPGAIAPPRWLSPAWPDVSLAGHGSHARKEFGFFRDLDCWPP